MSLQDKSKVWDYSTDKWVHRLLHDTSSNKMVNFENDQYNKKFSDDEYEYFSEKDSPIRRDNFQSKISSTEINCIRFLSEQMELQRHYWQKKVEEAASKNLAIEDESNDWIIYNGKDKNFDLTKCVKISGNEKAKVETRTNCTQTIETIEQIDNNQPLLQKLEAQNKQIKKLKLQFEKNLKFLEEERLISKNLNENLQIEQSKNMKLSKNGSVGDHTAAYLGAETQFDSNSLWYCKSRQ